MGSAVPSHLWDWSILSHSWGRPILLAHGIDWSLPLMGSTDPCHWWDRPFLLTYGIGRSLAIHGVDQSFSLMGLTNPCHSLYQPILATHGIGWSLSFTGLADPCHSRDRPTFSRLPLMRFSDAYSWRGKDCLISWADAAIPIYFPPHYEVFYCLKFNFLFIQHTVNFTIQSLSRLYSGCIPESSI